MTTVRTTETTPFLNLAFTGPQCLVAICFHLLRPRAPIYAPIDCKAEISSLESVEFVADEDYDLKPDVKVKLDPRMRPGIAALGIRPPPSEASSGSGEHASAAPGPSNYRTAALCRVSGGELGPADPPRKLGRPKGSKTRPRVAFNLKTLTERKEKVRAEGKLAEMSTNKQV